MKIPDNTLIQSISLRVRNIEDSVKFYSYLMGFKVIDKKPNQVFLSPNGKLPYLICLTESGNSKSRNPKSPGLFHAAFKFPSRKELGRVFLRLFNNQIKFQDFLIILLVKRFIFQIRTAMALSCMLINQDQNGNGHLVRL